MSYRICRICNEEKELIITFFRTTNNGRNFRYECRDCEADIRRMERKNNQVNYRASYSEWEKDRKRNNKLRAIDYKGGKCSACGGVYHPSVYDFHHIDPSTKEGSPGQMMKKTWDDIKAELDKCVLLCANCHRIEHNKY